ncbi:MAG: ABC transporter ATP-binding protein [Actinomycetota bacterium]|nr:ABC transporter ATP-binding protein [Actinomycetota bacterium]
MPHLPYRELPEMDPGSPPTRSPQRYLVWLARHQRGLLSLNALFGIGWMVAQALVWAAVGQAIDAGIVHHHPRALFAWVAVVMLLGIFQALCGSLRHQLAVTNWMHAAFRTSHLIGRHITATGDALTNEIPAGDIVNTVMADAMRVGGTFDSSARFAGSIVSWLVVTGILLSTSVQLGLIVLIGVPVLASLTVPLMRPLHRAQAAQREAAGRLAAQASDTVTGLRILRGVGGEDVFYRNYQRQNERVRQTGVRIATPQAGLESGQVLLPAVLTVVVTFIGAHDVMNGQLQAGQLVSFFGYTTFLTTPLRTAIDYVISVTRAYVGASKVLRILRISPTVRNDGPQLAWPEHFTELRDPTSGVTIREGVIVGLVSADSAEVVPLVERLGRFHADSLGVTLDATPLESFALNDTRRHIVVSEIEPRLFSGRLRDELTTRDANDDEAIEVALHAASATDVLELLDGGLSARVEERGRSFSGGQRQRLVLARALLTNADILILVEPTSAVDAHTEQRIAERLRVARSGRSTVLVTSSPLLLETTDEVYLLHQGRVVAHGTNNELLASSSQYRRIVLRTDEP